MKNWIVGLFAMLLSTAALAAVNVNNASQQELEGLNGIGPVKAKAIVEYRSKNGPFKSAADLVNVPGIGAKTVERLKPELVFSAAAPAAAKPAPATAKAAPAPVPPSKKP